MATPCASARATRRSCRQFRSPAEVMRGRTAGVFSPLISSAARPICLPATDATLARLQLSQAEADGTLALAGSVVDMEEDRLYDGVGGAGRGSRVVTFARVLKHNVFPLCAILNELFEHCRRDLGFAVEIEFAVDLDADPSRKPVFNFLQMRPLVASRERCDIASKPARRASCSAARSASWETGRIEGLRDIL